MSVAPGAAACLSAVSDDRYEPKRRQERALGLQRSVLRLNRRFRTASFPVELRVLENPYRLRYLLREFGLRG